MRILLVDDEPALRELLRVTFESADVTVDEAASAAEALARIRQVLPDVIILDLKMPVITGTELCVYLKTSARTRDIPIVLLTGAELEEARVAQAAGAEALVRKPFSPLELLSTVERLGGRGLHVPQAGPRSAETAEEVLLYARDLRHLLGIERRQRALLASSYLQTVTALATALEWKDVKTRAHSQRVQRYALDLLAVIDPELLDRDHGVEYGFLLHDLGKIAIPDEILQKPGRLTEDERDRMRQHTVIGEQMLAGVELLRGEGLRIVRSHHERWDGGGYPDGLRGDEIALGARIFSVADALDAMTSDRPYRPALPWEAARDEIVAERGGQFDPAVVDVFLDREKRLHEVHRELAAA
jgi:response regulator RpfG family c-di-GMP phosphodiesterase